MRQIVSGIFIIYLTLCALLQALFVGGFVAAVVIFQMPFSSIWLSVPIILRVIQIVLWIVIFRWAIRSIEYGVPDKAISKMHVFLCLSILVDLINSVTSLNLQGSSMSWEQMASAMREFYPSIASILESYGSAETYISIAEQTLNPIPFGAATITLLLLAPFFKSVSKDGVAR